MKITLLVIALGLAITSVTQAAVTITPQVDGLHLTDDNPALSFTIDYPALVTGDKKTTYKPSGAPTITDNTVTLTYDGGAQLLLTIDPAGKVTVKGTNLPSGTKYVQLRMSLDSDSAATWQFGSAKPQPFPTQKPPQPHLYQGNDTSFGLRASDGNGVLIIIPEFGYQELTDLEEWGTKGFSWMSLSDYSDDLAFNFQAAPQVTP